MNTGFANQLKLLLPEMAKLGIEIFHTSLGNEYGENVYLEKYKVTDVSSGANPTKNKGPVKMPQILRDIQPDLVLVVEDIHRIINWSQFLGSNQWCAWLPKDNEDETQKAEINTIRGIPSPISMTKFGADFYSRFGIQMPYVYNPIDTKEFRRIRNDKTRRQLGDRMAKRLVDAKARGASIITFVGRPNWRKNIELLLGAHRMLLDRGRDVILYLHMAQNDIDERLYKTMYSMGTMKNVVITGGYNWDEGVNKSVLSAIYNVSDVYVTTHAGEGFGLPMVEAMSCGVPVVGTDYTVTREWVGENQERGIAVPIKERYWEKKVYRPLVDLDKFAGAVEYLIDNPDVRNKMGNNAEKWVHETFSPPVIASQMRDILLENTCNTVSISEH